MAKKKKSVIRTVISWVIILAVLIAAGITFPEKWGPKLVSSVARNVLPHGEGYTNDVHVIRIGLSEIEVGAVCLGGVPSQPSFESAAIKYTIPGLFNKKIDSVVVRGFCVRPEYKVENFTMFSFGCAGPKKVNPDPLQGWTVGSLKVTTGDIDFSPILTGKAADLFPSGTASAVLDIGREDDNAYHGTLKGMCFGGDLTAEISYKQFGGTGALTAVYKPDFVSPVKSPGSVSVDLPFAVTSDGGYGISTKGVISIDGTNIKCDVNADVGAKGVNVHANVVKTPITEKHPVAVSALSFVPLPGTIKDVSFSGNVNASFDLAVTNSLPNWSASWKLRDVEGGLTIGKMPIKVGGGMTSGTVCGIGPHFDLMPMPVSFTNASAATLNFNGGRAMILADKEDLLISEGSIGFCGGFIRLYTLYLDFVRLSTGFTVFLDGLQISDFIKQFPEMEESLGTGSLYGRVPVRFLHNGTEIRLKDAFLYSPPGQEGNIQIADTACVKKYLSMIGVPASECENLAKAFENLNYSVVRFDLLNSQNSEIRREDRVSQICIKIKGESPQGKMKIPVNLDIKLNAQVEKLLNLGLKTATIGSK